MYPVLILREETVCLVILIFLMATSKTYQMGKDGRPFFRLTLFAMIHVVFDFITVLTVNNVETVPRDLNYVCHIIFYMAAILFSHEICNYIINMCYPHAPKKLYFLGLILPAVYLLLLPLLRIEYAAEDGTYSSTGSAAYVGYAIAFIYFIAAVIIILLNFKKLSASVKKALVPMMLVLITAETAQILVRELLFTGGAVTIVTVAFFFSLENPVHVFERKAMTDALTGVGSRHGYDQRIAQLEPKFKEEPSSDYVFAFFDINDLRAVNGLFGHPEGDNYITLVATILTQSLTSADGIYRMGGDEFVAMYHKVPEEKVADECRLVQEQCEKASPAREYIVSVSVGYAVSGPEYRSLRDVLRAADYMMYKNKAEMKNRKAYVSQKPGTHLNLTGLTDSVFSAMCASNEKFYPFIMNVETGVTRISPKWKDYFGLEDEFFHDFNKIWVEHVHPNDRELYNSTLAAVLGEGQRYHNCRYRAKNADGDYIWCTARGAIYHGKNGEADIYAGYLTNHGVGDTVDPATGLPEFSVTEDAVQKILDNGHSAFLVKMSINNYGRVNMLYGYDEGKKITFAIGEKMREAIGEHGTVYSHNGVNFTALLPGATREQATEFYATITDKLRRGIVAESEDGISHPLFISGGAFEITENCTLDRQTIRSGLIYALDESIYHEHGRLIFCDDLSVTSGTPGYELLTDIHSDAVSEKKNFAMYYQPILDIQSGEVVGAEALLRWNSPKYGLVPPSRFIGFIETDPCFTELGPYIIRRAIADAKAMRKLIPNFTVNVNITAIQLRDDSFIGEVEKILEEENYPENGVILELTERCKELEEKVLNDRIEALRRIGIRVAFDDMGTGHSTISLLMNTRVDEIKLDRDFVCGMAENPSYRIFVEALVRGKQLDDYVICFEGIEDEETLEMLRGFGNNYCQGFLFSQPLPPEEFKKYILEHK